MSHIFISHTDADKAIVDRIHNLFKKDDHPGCQIQIASKSKPTLLMNGFILRLGKILSVVVLLLGLNYSPTAALDGTVYAVAWSPDGTRIAVGGGMGNIDCGIRVTDIPIEIVDAETGEVITRLQGIGCAVTALAWSPDGKQIAGISNDELGLYIWDVTTSERVIQAPLRLPRLVRVAWSHDGTKIAVTGVDDSLHLLDAATGELLTSVRDNGTTLAWSPDDKSIRTGSTSDPEPRGYIVETGESLILHGWGFGGHADGITAITWNPRDANQFATASFDQTIRARTGAGTPADFVIVTGQNVITDLAWSPDGSKIASSAQDGSVKVWSVPTGELIESYRSSGPVYDLDWNPEGTKLVYTGKTIDGGEDGLPFGTFTVVAVPQTTKLTVHSIDWNQDGSQIAYGGKTNPCSASDLSESTIRIFNTQTQTVEHQLPLDECSFNKLEWHPDSRRIVISDRKIQVLDIDTGHVLLEKCGYMGSLPIYAGWNPDGQYLAAGSDGTVGIVDATTGEERSKEFSNTVIWGTLLAWSPDSHTLLTGSNGALTTDIPPQTFYLYDASSGQQIKMLQAPLLKNPGEVYDSRYDIIEVTWSSDGKYFAAANGFTLLVWDAQTYELQTTITLNQGHDLTWRPNSREIAVADGEAGVSIWNADTGKRQQTLGYAGEVLAVDWSPDGNYLAYGGERSDATMPEITITAVN